MTSVSIGMIVRADSDLEAQAVSFLRLPAGHRDQAVLEECGPERFLLGGWYVRWQLPSMTVREAIIGPMFEDELGG